MFNSNNHIYKKHRLSKFDHTWVRKKTHQNKLDGWKHDGWALASGYAFIILDFLGNMDASVGPDQSTNQVRTSVILLHLCLLLSQVSDCCSSFLNRALAAPADLWMCSVTSALCKALLGQKGVASTCWLESWLGITHCIREDSFGLYTWWTCHWKLTQRPYPGLHRRRKDYETQERLGHARSIYRTDGAVTMPTFTTFRSRNMHPKIIPLQHPTLATQTHIWQTGVD